MNRDVSTAAIKLESLPLTRSQRSAARKLLQAIASSASASETEQLLAQLLEVLSAGKSATSTARKLLPFGGRKSDTDATEQRLYRLLDHLLGHLDFMAGEGRDTYWFRDRLQEAQNGQAIDGVLDEVEESLVSADRRLAHTRDTNLRALENLRDQAQALVEQARYVSRQLQSVDEKSFAAVGKEPDLSGETLNKPEAHDPLAAGLVTDTPSRTTSSTANTKASTTANTTEITTNISTPIGTTSSTTRSGTGSSKVISLQSETEKMAAQLQVMERQLNELHSGVRSSSDLALKDAATGAYADKGFQSRTRELLARSHRSQSPLVLLIVSVGVRDGFELSPLSQLALMRLCAAETEKRTRTSDIFGRLSEAEFCLLLPDTNIDGGNAFASRLVIALETAGFNQFGDDVRIAISAGLTEAREDDDANSFLHRARAASHHAVVTKLATYVGL